MIQGDLLKALAEHTAKDVQAILPMECRTDGYYFQIDGKPMAGIAVVTVLPSETVVCYSVANASGRVIQHGAFRL